MLCGRAETYATFTVFYKGMGPLNSDGRSYLAISTFGFFGCNLINSFCEICIVSFLACFKSVTLLLIIDFLRILTAYFEFESQESSFTTCIILIAIFFNGLCSIWSFSLNASGIRQTKPITRIIKAFAALALS